LNSGPSPWITPSALFLWRFFEIGSHGTICPGWLQTVILLISASWVATIIGVRHQHQAHQPIFQLRFVLLSFVTGCIHMKHILEPCQCSCLVSHRIKWECRGRNH
jgi:hypothetical protein